MSKVGIPVTPACAASRPIAATRSRTAGSRLPRSAAAPSSPAAAAGLDGPLAVRGSREGAILERVAAMGREAARAGVTGIPTFDVGDERVVGAQPYEVLAAAARRAGSPGPR
jgi:protein-disulfide isomerase